MKSLRLLRKERIALEDTLSPLLLKEGSGKEGRIDIYWLGQAGFLLSSEYVMLAIDPYLSNVLEDKYRETVTPHIRMMPPPVSPSLLSDVDLLFSTHPHIDHLDPGTLKPIYEHHGNKTPKMILPRSSVEKAGERGVPFQKMILLDKGESIEIKIHEELIRVSAISSAHEQLSYDSWGNSFALGFIIDINGLRIYHSGDTLVYDNLGKILKDMSIDMALLPVNGRNETLAKHGIAGNMNVKEAGKLCKDAGIGFLIPHHFGMFEFNTVSPATIRSELEQDGWVPDKNTVLCEPGYLYCIGEEQ